MAGRYAPGLSRSVGPPLCATATPSLAYWRRRFYTVGAPDGLGFPGPPCALRRRAMKGDGLARPDPGRIAHPVDQLATHAVETAAERDATAAVRDETARLRDVRAEALDRSIAGSDAPMADKLEHVRARASAARVRAADDRGKAAQDRFDAAGERSRLEAELNNAHM